MIGVIAKEGDTREEEKDGDCGSADIVGKKIADSEGKISELVGWEIGILISGRVMNNDNKDDGYKRNDSFLLPKVGMNGI